MKDKKDITIFSISRAFYSVSFLIISFILVRTLSSSDYGRFQEFFIITRLFIPVIGGVISHFIFYRYPNEEDKKKFLGNIIIITHSIGFIAALLGSIVGYFLYKDVQNYVITTEIALFIYIFLVSAVSFYEHFLISLNKYEKASIYLVIVSFFLISFVVLPAILSSNVKFVFYGIGLYAIGRYFWVVVSLRGGFSISLSIFSYIKKYSFYLIPLLGTYFVGKMSVSMDKIIVSFFSLPEEFALYINGVIAIPFIGILINSIVNSLLPKFSQYLKTDKKLFLEQWHLSMIFIATFLYPVVFFAFFFAKHIMGFFFSSQYIPSAVYFRIGVLVLFVRITSFGSILSILGRSGSLFIVSLLDMLVNAFLGILLFFFLGLIGPAISFVVVTYLQIIAFIVIISRSIGFSFKKILPYKKLWEIFVFSFIANFAIYVFVKIVGPVKDSYLILFSLSLLFVFLLLRYIKEKYAYILVGIFPIISIPLILFFAYPVIVAHKGDISIEESRKSILSAQERGYKYIESDVHLLSDTVLVFSHDPILRGEKILPYSEAKNIYFVEYGETLSLVREIFQNLDSVEMFLELKTYGTEGINTEEGKRLDYLLPKKINTLFINHNEKIAYIISFDPNVLEKIDKTAKRGFLIGEQTVKIVANMYHVPRKVAPYLIGIVSKQKDFDGLFLEKTVYSFPLFLFYKVLGFDVYVWTLKETEEYAADGLIKNIE